MPSPKKLSEAKRPKPATQRVRTTDSGRPASTTSTHVALAQIKDRPNGATRVLRPAHVLELAESIAKVGLLEPLVLDKEYRLIAGAHRLSALRILLAPSRAARLACWNELLTTVEAPSKPPDLERVSSLSCSEDVAVSGKQVPVNVLPFDAVADPKRALIAETAENEKRVNYTQAEIVELVRQHQEVLGQVKQNGRPKKGETSACAAVAATIGCSLRTVKRAMATAGTKATRRQPANRPFDLLAADVAKHLRSAEVQGHDAIRGLLEEVRQRLLRAQKP